LPSQTKGAPRGLLAGRPKISMRRTDGRSQRMSLADNLQANAADVVKAVHAVAEWGRARSASRGKPAPAGGGDTGPSRVFLGLSSAIVAIAKIGRQCGFQVIGKHGQAR